MQLPTEPQQTVRIAGVDIPTRWLPAYRQYQHDIERQYAVTAAWVVLFSVLAYQLSYSFRQISVPLPWSLEQLIRLPVYFATILTLVAHYTGVPAFSPKVFLRLISFTLMAMMLALLAVFLQGKPDSLGEVSHGLVISFFGVSLVTTRGLRDWALQLLVPLLLFAGYAVAQGLPLLILAPHLFAPTIMMVVGLATSETLRRLHIRQFMANRQLEEMATTDQLTGLLNRHAMLEILDREVSRADRNNERFSLILGDLDLFKRVNDTYGHDVGDQVLKETAKRMGSQMRAQDSLCRWGGEELLMLLPETDHKGALRVAEKVRRFFSDHPITTGRHEIPQTISLGVATWRKGEAVNMVIKRADQGLYRAKTGGRNLVGSAEGRPQPSVSSTSD